jgi:CBS-domain-containing membrane protein
MVLRWTTAAELMTPSPLSFQKSDSLQKVAAQLSFHGLDAAPVIDDAGRLVGQVSAAACSAWEAFSHRSSPHGFSPADLQAADISEIVNPIIETVRDDAPTREVIVRLRQRKTRRVYVVNAADELVGVISLTDVLRRLEDGNGASRAYRAAAALLC